MRRSRLSATVAVGALLLATAPAAQAASPVKGGRYSGGTLSERLQPGSDFEFRVSRGGGRLSGSILSVTRCSNGRLFFTIYEVSALIAGGGAFSGGVEEPPSELRLDPFLRSSRLSFEGAFRGSGGRRATVLLRSQAVGEGGTTCESGEVRLTVRLRRRPRR